MRQVDVVLSVLTLVAVGMGVAAYRAWHPNDDISQPVSAVETQLVQSLPRVASAPAARLNPVRWENDSRSIPLKPGSEGGVRCWQGFLLRQTGHQWVGMAAPDGRGLAQCEILAEPVRPESSEASD